MNLLRIYNTRLLSNRNELDLKFNNEKKKKKRKNLIETASYVSPIES